MTSLPSLAPLAGLLLLLEISAGTLVASAALDQVGRVGRGYAGTTAAICAALMGLDLLLLNAATNLSQLLHRPLPADATTSLAHWMVALTVALVLDTLFAAVGTEAARRVVAALTGGIGIGTLVQAALSLAPATGGPDQALLTILPSSALGGAALAGMLLGHWYLVTPALSFRPLRISVVSVFAAIAIDIAAITTALLIAAPAQRSRLLTGDLAELFWLLVVGSGVLFTAAVNGLTLYFARIRANQPATAMLYVLIVSVVMGIVPAHLLFLVTGVAV